MSSLVEFFQVFKVLKLTISRNKQGILLNFFWGVSITQVGPRYEIKLNKKASSIKRYIDILNKIPLYELNYI